MTRRDEPPRDISTERKGGEWDHANKYTAIPIFLEYAPLQHSIKMRTCYYNGQLNI